MKAAIISQKCFRAKVLAIENADTAHFSREVIATTENAKDFSGYELERLKNYQMALSELINSPEYIGRYANAIHAWKTTKMVTEIKFLNQQIKRLEKEANVC